MPDCYFRAQQRWREAFSIEEQNLIYKPCCVALLDLLGFREIVQAFGQDAPSRILSIIRRAIHAHDGLYDHVSMHFYGDTVVLATSSQDHVKVWDLLNVVHLIWNELFLSDILIRGAVVFGDHFEAANVMISPAMIKAYIAESQLAKLPRVLIDADVAVFLRNWWTQEETGSIGVPQGNQFRLIRPTLIEADHTDGWEVLNPWMGFEDVYFMRFNHTGQPRGGAQDLSKERRAQLIESGTARLEAAKIQIEAKLRRNFSNPHVYSKIAYTAELFNRLLAQLEGRLPEGHSLRIHVAAAKI